jgi:hypothetical protein
MPAERLAECHWAGYVVLCFVGAADTTEGELSVRVRTKGGVSATVHFLQR